MGGGTYNIQPCKIEKTEHTNSQRPTKTKQRATEKSSHWIQTRVRLPPLAGHHRNLLRRPDPSRTLDRVPTGPPIDDRISRTTVRWQSHRLWRMNLKMNWRKSGAGWSFAAEPRRMSAESQPPAYDTFYSLQKLHRNNGTDCHREVPNGKPLGLLLSPHQRIEDQNYRLDSVQVQEKVRAGFLLILFRLREIVLIRASPPIYNLPKHV